MEFGILDKMGPFHAEPWWSVRAMIVLRRAMTVLRVVLTIRGIAVTVRTSHDSSPSTLIRTFQVPMAFLLGGPLFQFAPQQFIGRVAR